MTKQLLTRRVGILFILSHVIIFVLLGISRGLGGMTFEQSLTAYSIILPVFCGYTAMILRHLIKEARKRERARAQKGAPNAAIVGALELDPGTVTVILTFAVAFPLLVAVAIGLKSFNIVLNEFLHFEVGLLLIEIAFGAAIGLIFEYLFQP